MSFSACGGAALSANSLIFVAKLAAWTASGGSALLAEAIHSLADIGNQAMLRVGILKASEAPSSEFPYGHMRDKFIFRCASRTHKTIRLQHQRITVSSSLLFALHVPKASLAFLQHHFLCHKRAHGHPSRMLLPCALEGNTTLPSQNNLASLMYQACYQQTHPIPMSHSTAACPSHPNTYASPFAPLGTSTMHAASYLPWESSASELVCPSCTASTAWPTPSRPST